MSAPPDPTLLRSLITSLFPWLAGVSVSARALVIGSATKAIELAGGGPGVARVGDVCGYDYLEVVIAAGVVTAVTLWRSTGNGSASSWSVVASGVLPPVNGVTSGTAVTVTTGSARVTCG